MITRTAITAAAFLALTVVPVQAQQHPHGQGMQGGQTGMMMSCPSAQQMMQGMMSQGMHGQGQGMMGQGMHGQGMQGQGMQSQGMQGQMGGGMMGMMGSLSMGPGMLLGVSDALGLTPEQVEQLTALQERTRTQHQAHVQAASNACQAAASALEADSPDLDAYTQALNEVADHMVAGRVAMTRTALEAREILTAEQLEKLDDVISKAHGMGNGGMMQGGTTEEGSGSGHESHH